MHALEAFIDPLEAFIDPFEAFIDPLEARFHVPPLFAQLVFHSRKPLVHLLKPLVNLLEPLVNLLEPLVNLLEPFIHLDAQGVELRLEHVHPGVHIGFNHDSHYCTANLSATVPLAVGLIFSSPASQ